MSIELNIQAKKIELIQWLSAIEDISVLDKVSDLLSKERRKDEWISLSNAEKKSIEKGIHDADNGKLNADSKVREIYGKWL